MQRNLWISGRDCAGQSKTIRKEFLPPLSQIFPRSTFIAVGLVGYILFAVYTSYIMSLWGMNPRPNVVKGTLIAEINSIHSIERPLPHRTTHKQALTSCSANTKSHCHVTCGTPSVGRIFVAEGSICGCPAGEPPYTFALRVAMVIQPMIRWATVLRQASPCL